MSEFSGKTIAIVGLSVEGQDTLSYFRKKDCTILCVDRRDDAPELRALQTRYEDNHTKFYFGSGYLEVLRDADIVVCTPGISPRTPELVRFRKSGKVITSATQLFFETCPAPIIGVTGTKGKGTTSTLIYEMLSESGKRVYLGGNVGTSLLSNVDDMHASDWVVLELSSFQLESVFKSPHIAVVLGITQDHLANVDRNATNFHPTRHAYIEAKAHIVRYQTKNDILVVNVGDPTAESFTKLTPARILRFNRYSHTGADCFVENHAVYFIKDDGEELIAKQKEIKLLGDHNLENIAAATLAAYHAGASIPAIKKIAREFKGLEHRLQHIRTVHSVRYIDDSFSTVPETTIAAIEAFSEPKILILGGSEKKSDFSEMGRIITKTNVEGVVVIGQMTERIVKALQSGGYTGAIVTGCTTMKEIVEKARTLARSGSVVILSPACASFDMFKNYKERGNLFIHEVRAL